MEASVDADTLARLVVEKYASLPPKLRVQATEWTVLAGLVARTRLATSDEYEYQVITIATGTKCLASADLVDGHVLRDLHAEVLCRRALCLLLYEDIERLHAGSQGRLLTQNGGIYTLRDDLTLHLVISDSPCGCASEFSRVVVGSADSASMGNPRISGAKRVRTKDSHADENSDEDRFHLRTKPYRSDLPMERRSRCMSCSDKILKWQVLGLQGSLLSLLGLETIRLTSVILLKDAALTCIDGGDPTPGSLEVAKTTVLKSLGNSLNRLREAKTTIGLSLEHSFTNSRIRICPPAQGREKSKSAGKVTWWAVNGLNESLVGVRGVKEGSNKHAQVSKVASMLSKIMLLRKFLELHSRKSDGCCEDGNQVAESQCTYLDWKKKARDYRVKLENFRRIMCRWNVNEAFDLFILES